MARFKFIKLFKLRSFRPTKINKTFDPKKVDHLKLGIILVKKGHGVAVNNILFNHGVAMSMLLFGEGTREKYVADILGGEEHKVEAIITVINEKKVDEIKQALSTRFDISNDSVGAMFIFNIKSMAGVLAYKYLADFGGASNYGK